MNKSALSKIACVLFVFCAATAITASAQILTTLHRFNGGADGYVPFAGLIQASDGNFYGTTRWGGADGGGEVFKITPSGTLTTVYSFTGNDGSEPVAALVQAADGNFYSTTYTGGLYGGGTVFKLTPGGSLTTLHSFNGNDGSNPVGALVQASDGNFYGTTSGGGTVFKITPSGAFTTLHSFNGSDGSDPVASLVQAADGDFYGTTYSGGLYNVGTVFKITPVGTLTTLYSFCSQPGCADGTNPSDALIQATDGYLYGTTTAGAERQGSCQGKCGTVFKISPSGALTTLHGFSGPDGAAPCAGLVQAKDGNLYGMTYEGGANNGGTFFRITANGTLSTLYNFCSQPGCADGLNPFYAVLIQARDGNFYGGTEFGGTNNGGTLFRMAPSRGCSVRAAEARCL